MVAGIGRAEIIETATVTLNVAGDGRDTEGFDAGRDVIQRRARVRENIVVPGRVMFTDEIEIAGQEAAGDAAINVDSRLKGVISSEQSESGGRRKNLGIRSWRKPRSWIALIINDGTIAILNQDSPAIGRNGGACENGIDLVGNGLCKPGILKK